MPINLVINSEQNNTGLNSYSKQLITELDKKCIEYKLIKCSQKNNILKRLLCFLGFDGISVLNNFPLMFRLPNETIHFTNQQQAISLCFSKPSKSIVTVHDIIPLATNTYNSFFEKILYELAYAGLKKSDCLIADSESAKKDLIAFLGTSSEKICVVHLGVDLNIFKPSRSRRRKNTLLYVGSEMPRKNLKTLFEAIALVKKKIASIKLIKIGKPQWTGAREELIKLAGELEISQNIIFTDYSNDLAGEYRNCTLFVFPSKYEGFGLPVLEAMACGCAVVCTAETSLPEIGGDAVQYFDAENPEDLASKIYLLLTNEILRKEFEIKAYKRAKNFSWEKTAEKTVEVYNNK